MGCEAFKYYIYTFAAMGMVLRGVLFYLQSIFVLWVTGRNALDGCEKRLNEG